MVIDRTEKLYMIAISNHVEKLLPVQWGVSVDIPGLSVDGHSYSGTRGYTDMVGGGGSKCGHPLLSMAGHS